MARITLVLSIPSRFVFLGCLAISACAAPHIPTGTYELSWSSKEPLEVWQAELIVMPEPIDITLFQPYLHRFSRDFGIEPNQTICIIDRYTVIGETFTSLYLSRPEHRESSLRVQVAESPDSQTWLIFDVKGSSISGTHHFTSATGEGGYYVHEMTVRRIGNADLEHCIAAQREVIPVE
jgi:hypothetical protein